MHLKSMNRLTTKNVLKFLEGLLFPQMFCFEAHHSSLETFLTATKFLVHVLDLE